MSSYPAPPDQANRHKVIDPTKSFIVKAPAGSGKTTLLVERFLRLLAIVNQPEQVIAITFTRKATSEMRNRILERLQKAQQNQNDDTIAQSVIARDEQHGWNLVNHPSRLNVITIDGLANFITHALPLSASEEGLAQSIGDYGEPWYALAAERAIEGALNDKAQRMQAETVLALLSYDQGRLTKLLALMLAKRSVWQRYIFEKKEDEFVQAVEETWSAISREWRQSLYKILSALSADFRALSNAPMTKVLPEVARFMQSNLDDSNPKRITLRESLSPLAELVNVTVDAPIEAWQLFAPMLLTDKGELRKTVNVNNGFPRAAKDEKEQFLDIIRLLAENLKVRDVQHLFALPNDEFSSSERDRLKALRTVLVRALAELKLLFAEYGVSDFDAITEAAVNALGEDGRPSELALALDYKIQHILIDEFQDTSIAQIHLIEKLTAGWQQGDGRTLFIVGDPMQSIYRFRGAEVSNFTKIWRDKGFPSVRVEPISIQANFRSHKTLVTWVNQAFPAIFDLNPNDNAPFEEAISAKIEEGSEQTGMVRYHAALTKEAEGEQIVALVQRIQNETPGYSIALLANTRSALSTSVKALKEAGILVDGLKLESLWEQSVTRDLWILTRALHDLSDTIAWAALLRARWFDIGINEVHSIMRRESVFTQTTLNRIAEQFGEGANAVMLNRLARIVAERASQRLDDLVLRAYDELRGWRAYANVREFAQEYFLLLTAAINNQIVRLDELEEKLKKHHVDTISNDQNAVIATTIHQAKGLEYDVVIMPSCGQTPKSDNPDLLSFGQYNENGTQHILFSEHPDSEQSNLGRRKVFKMLEDNHESQERFRRLYVVTTRAKSQLHISWVVKNTEKFTVPSKSLLAPIYDVKMRDSTGASMDDMVQALIASKQDADAGTEGQRQSQAKRIVVHYDEHQSVKLAKNATSGAGYQPLDWQPERSTFFGTAMHAYFEAIAEVGFSQWWQLSDTEQKSRAQSYLARGGVVHLYNEVVSALKDKLQLSENAAWILAQYPNAACEWELQSVEDEGVKKHIIDRTLIKDGVRYIIDYKAGADYEKPKAEYIEQLKRYYSILCEIEDLPIVLALYYPLRDKLWQFKGGSEPDFEISE